MPWSLRLLGVSLAALIAAAAAHAIYAPPIPNSESPAWLDNATIRFESNLEAFRTHDYQLHPYVMRADGSGVRPATDAEAQQTPASRPGERLMFASTGPSYGAPLILIDAQGQRHLIESSADQVAGAALSPDGATVVFAELLGEHNAESVALYGVPTDGSTEPRRLTPTLCTFGGCLDGTDGPDRLVGSRYGDLVIAGSGDDVIRSGDGQDRIEGQWGDDDIRAGSGFDHVWGGAGNDFIRTGSGRAYVSAGPGRDRVFSGAGPDIVVSNDGERDVIDCGAGDDRARVDRLDVTHNCEHVHVAAPAPDNPRP